MLLVTAAAATNSTTTTANSQMDAHYDFQIRQQHQPPTFHGPARQFGSGGMGAFAMRMGRVAMPLMKKYVLPVAKEFGRNLVSSFVPELASIASDKKRTRKAVRDVLKNSANKTIAKASGTRRVAEAGAGAVVAGKGEAAGGRAKRCRRPAGRATAAIKRSTSVKTSPVHVVVPHHRHPSARKRSHSENESRQEKLVWHIIQNKL